jgi:hypothetical protein
MFFFPTPTADEAVYLESAGGPLKLTAGELRAIQKGMLPGSRRIPIKRRGASEESAVVDFDLSAVPEFVSVLSGRANTVRLAERLRSERGDEWVFDWLRTRLREGNRLMFVTIGARSWAVLLPIVLGFAAGVLMVTILLADHPSCGVIPTAPPHAVGGVR